MNSKISGLQPVIVQVYGQEKIVGYAGPGVAYKLHSVIGCPISLSVPANSSQAQCQAAVIQAYGQARQSIQNCLVGRLQRQA